MRAITIDRDSLSTGSPKGFRSSRPPSVSTILCSLEGPLRQVGNRRGLEVGARAAVCAATMFSYRSIRQYTMSRLMDAYLPATFLCRGGGAEMPRSYFHVKRGQVTLLDREGVELVDIAEATNEAARRGR
jgi:hypothetical protein